MEGTSSIISSGAAKLGFGPTLMIATGGLSGGISAHVSGGSFWAGVRQGVTSSGLNHGMHMETQVILIHHPRSIGALSQSTPRLATRSEF